jgi:ABC-type multidrug transport system fused ATPase/permease subunit
LLDRSILENIAYGLVSSAVEQHQRLAPFILDSSLPDLAEKIRGGISEKEALREYDSCVSEIVDLVKDAAANANALGFIEALPYGLATNVGTAGIS